MDALLLLHPIAQGDRPRSKGSRRLFHRARRPARYRGTAPLAPYVFASVSVCDARLFRDSPDGPFSLLQLWNRAEAAGRLFGLVHDGDWFHVGTPAGPRRRRTRAGDEGRLHHRHRPPLRRRAGGGRAGRAWRRSAGAGRRADPAADAALGAGAARGLPARRRTASPRCCRAWRRWATSTKANGRWRRATAARSPCRPPSSPPSARRCWRSSCRPSRTTRAIPSPSRRRRRSSSRASSAGCSTSWPSRACRSTGWKAWSRATSPATGSARSRSSPSSARHWPKVLAERGQIDAIERRTRAIRAQAARWREHPPATPVIAAGSTGSQPATRELLAVIADLPQGAVVLPGLDRDMDEASWKQLDPIASAVRPARAPGGARLSSARGRRLAGRRRLGAPPADHRADAAGRDHRGLVAARPHRRSSM